MVLEKHDRARHGGRKGPFLPPWGKVSEAEEYTVAEGRVGVAEQET